MACGKISKSLSGVWTPLVYGELKHLKVGIVELKAGQRHVLETGEYEFGLVLITGYCDIEVTGELKKCLGPRTDPFLEKPFAATVTRECSVTITALTPTILGVGSAPAERVKKNMIIRPEDCKEELRGTGNWQRTVRFVLWSDNSEGNMLLMGETVTPAGNWSTIPPHRHQYDIPGEEVPYEEAYYFRFSNPNGFALGWQFDDEGLMDQAYSIRHGDLLYMDRGYHPVACAPGTLLYQLTLMAGPQRQSKSSIHPDFKFLLEEKGMENPYAAQYVKGGRDGYER